MSLPADLRFIFQHPMPYTALPVGHEQYPSTWVEFPNTFYDPPTGYALWQRYWDEVILADQLGLDVMITEHHATAHNLNASASVTAAAVIPRTERAKIYMAGSQITLQYPSRLAEEYAMLDVISQGRLVVCLPLGFGQE